MEYNRYMSLPSSRTTITKLLLLLGVLFFTPNTVSATTVSPIRLEFAVDPGQSVTTSFDVTNNKDEFKTYSISIARFETRDETGDPAFVPNDRRGIPSWATVPSQVQIPAKTKQTVPITIAVPQDAEPGGYFAAAFAIDQAPDQEEANAIGVGSNVGTLIFLRVNGDFAEGETVLEFNTKNKQKLFASLPVEFYYRLQNSGEDRIKPQGDITIKNIFGRISKTINANRTTGSVLPRSIRRFEAGWYVTGGEPVQDLNAQPEYPKNNSYLEQLKFQWNHFAFGYYTANMQVTVNNDSSRSYARSVSFWIIPWHLLSIALAFLIIELRRKIYRAISWLFKKLFRRA